MVESDDRETRRGALRVAHVGSYAPDSPIGPQKAIAGMLQNLPRHGVDVELWHFARHAHEVAWEEIDGIRVLNLPRRGRLTGFLTGLPKPTKEALRARSTQVDLVHFHSVFIAENARMRSLLRIPYIISPRGGYNRSVLHGRNRVAKKIWLALHERRYISSARALHAVSAGEATELEELVPSERVFCIPNGIDQHILDRPIQNLVGKTLLFLGRLAVQHKGIDLLLEGYSAFLKESGDKSSDLIIAGPDFRGDKQRIEEQIHALGLQNRVSLPGGVFGDNKWKLLDRAYAFVLTSRWEGMPFALLEALAAGRPALVTPETNMGVVVNRYNAGIQVTGDAGDIAAGIKSLLNLPRNEHIRMQHQARRLIGDQFTWQRIAGDLATHYRDIVGKDSS
jgi:glycosyltransferase involved in cell wall biosynthesis